MGVTCDGVSGGGGVVSHRVRSTGAVGAGKLFVKDLEVARESTERLKKEKKGIANQNMVTEYTVKRIGQPTGTRTRTDHCTSPRLQSNVQIVRGRKIHESLTVTKKHACTVMG